MKILMINGSAHASGNTAAALAEMEKIFREYDDVETELLQVGREPIRGCIGCQSCYRTGKCAFDDLVNEAAVKFETADALVIGSPVYYASPNGTLLAFLDRLFYSTHFDKTMKVGAGIVAARRGGTTAAFDALNKYFAISGMPIATSQYWNNIHGAVPGEAAHDGEGLQIMRTLAQNMVFLMRSIELGKERYGLPEKEKYIRTNFIR